MEGLKSDYRYSPSEKQKKKIEKNAEIIFDACALYSDSSLADLYDEVAILEELRKTHQQNDRAVIGAYGFPSPIATE